MKIEGTVEEIKELLGITIEDIDLTKEKISILRRGDEEDE